MARSTVAALAWMPARSYGRAFDAGRPVGVAVHCTESDNGPGTAESLAGPGWFGGPAGTSAHKMFDRNSGVEMVRRSRISYHAGPRGNVCAIAYEFCGRAGWSREKWHAPEQLQMLALAAPHIADDLRAIGAPARWLSLAQLAQAARTGNPGAGGLFTHNDIRLALGGTTHTDPGPNFPYAYLLERVLEELDPSEEDDMTPEQSQKLDDLHRTLGPDGDVVGILTGIQRGVDGVRGAVDQLRGVVDAFVAPIRSAIDDTEHSPRTFWAQGNRRVFDLIAQMDAFRREVREALAARQGDPR